MKRYNWQQEDWPHFKFSLDRVEDDLLIFSEKVGRVSGILEGLPEETKQDVIVDIILAEAIKTSEEGTKGFEGGMTATKYIGITKTSKATATRDMQQLLEIGAFMLSGKQGGEVPAIR